MSDIQPAIPARVVMPAATTVVAFQGGSGVRASLAAVDVNRPRKLILTSRGNDAVLVACGWDRQGLAFC